MRTCQNTSNPFSDSNGGERHGTLARRLRRDDGDQPDRSLLENIDGTPLSPPLGSLPRLCHLFEKNLFYLTTSHYRYELNITFPDSV